MKRRTFIAGLGSAAAWPVAGWTQQREGIRRIGWLLNGEENDPISQARTAELREGLAKLGWIEGRNLRIDLRFTGVDTNRVDEAAAELFPTQSSSHSLLDPGSSARGWSDAANRPALQT